MANQTKVESEHGESFDVLKSLNDNADALRAGNAKARDAVVADCLRLAASLETPSETFMRTLWSHSIHPPVLRLASDVRLFEILRDAQGPSKSSKELADAAGVDVRLMNSMLKTLASFHAVKEVDVDRYAATALSTSMAEERWKEALQLMVPYASNANLRTPEYFQQRNYRWPDNPLDCPVQFATGDSGKLSFFEVMKRDDQFRGLEGLMKVWLDNRPHWSDEKAGFYPVTKRLIEGADTKSESVFLVDVGGGHGQDFPRFFANIPLEQVPGRLVLQDLPTVIESIPEDSLPSSVEKMSYDFFTPQPIEGARVYFMHNILHNHTDDKCKIILKQVAAAMKKGYSKLLLWNNVMPTKDAGIIVTALDWEMLTFYGTSEKTEAEWRKMLEDPEVGLKVTDFVHYSRYDQDVIEVELV